MTTARFFYRDPDAPTPNRPPSLGVLALIERDQALLLERRSDCGRWGLIGGAVDPHESLTDALCREVREETGLTVTGYRLFGTFSDPTRIAAYPDGNVMRVIGIAYTVEVADFNDLRISDESLDLRLFTRDELSSVDLVETARPIIDAYLTQQPIILA
ncbi:MAG: NUDIX domain-containing protein [Dehalococcoidia bacterium]